MVVLALILRSFSPDSVFSLPASLAYMLSGATPPISRKSFALAGRIFQFGLPVQVKASYVKAELVLSVPNTRHLQDVFPKQNPVKFEFAHEKAHLLEGFQLGDEVTVQFTIVGREYVRDG